MCFRPHRTSYDSSIETSECPTCHMPIAYQEGTTEGTCPYCGNYIPPRPPSEYTFDPNNNDYRVL